MAPMWGRWGTPQNFLLSFIDELWKPLKNQTFEEVKNLLEISSFYTCTKNHNHMRYSSWDRKWDRIFCHFGPFFCSFNNPENQSFEEMKKASWDVIILNLGNEKQDHMIYAYSDKECSHRHNFLPFQAIFCSFAQLLTP